MNLLKKTRTWRIVIIISGISTKQINCFTFGHHEMGIVQKPPLPPASVASWGLPGARKIPGHWPQWIVTLALIPGATKEIAELRFPMTFLVWLVGISSFFWPKLKRFILSWLFLQEVLRGDILLVGACNWYIQSINLHKWYTYLQQFRQYCHTSWNWKKAEGIPFPNHHFSREVSLSCYEVYITRSLCEDFQSKTPSKEISVGC